MNNSKDISCKTTLLFAGLSFFICGCGGYDQGYDDAWDETKEGLSYAFSESYKNGYEDGADDVYFFDLGCSDVQNSERPQCLDLAVYMKGYRECR